MQKREITFEEVQMHLVHKLKQAPLEGDNKYYQVSISLPIEETSSLTGYFLVIAKDKKRAHDKSFEYAIKMRERDDLNDSIKWELVPTNNSDKMDYYQFDIHFGPVDEKGYLDHYSRESWDGFVQSDIYDQQVRKSRSSSISDWKWPIIFIPLIIWMLSFLNSII